ncbi:DPP IV N-terminal domain-containing protein [Aestuariibacter halophilus]|uniref:DPP IV N-terminal domain-containing protein n=1 Tax=Fluctibacter halophilus TaxID=226011 RepID=A0ABS8G3H0_9ALTE|nr:DPP IV N-terminal domain-containing protein [Aestuariibacter halophilus]MCC2615003.1 DPP IV N-terminal domain-containing protein [Aestuariibacter halophilus]
MRHWTLLITLSLLGCQTNNSPTLSSTAPASNNLAIAKARQWEPDQTRDLVTNLSIIPHWLDDTGHGFWYQHIDAQGKQRFVQVSAGQRKLLFDHGALASALQKVAKATPDWQQQPLSNVIYDKDALRVQLDYRDQRYACSMTDNDYQCAPYQPDNTPDPTPVRVEVRDYNLWLCKLARCTPLTDDGSEQQPYAIRMPSPDSYFDDPAFDEQQDTQVLWSADKRFAMTYQLDRRNVTRLTLTAPSDDFGVQGVTYYYPQAGDEHTVKARPVLIDVGNQRATKLDTPPVTQTYYGGALWGEWVAGKFYFLHRSRDNRTYTLNEVDPTDSRVRAIIRERANDFIDPWVQEFHVLPSRNEVIWSSQRSGFNHYYLYDSQTGRLKRALTQGHYTTRQIKAVDSQRGRLFFTASGAFDDRDPYLQHLYRVDLDNPSPVLLTPEPFEHRISVSPDRRYFVDTYSDTATPPLTVLRSAEDGRILDTLAKANASALYRKGWQPPEPFAVLAEDGETWLYGLLFKPFDFDPGKRYPVIDNIYTGPHGFFTPKTFNTFSNHRLAMAQLGYIVIRMDGRGTSRRGRAFHSHSYKNLATGSDDHVWAMRQLAKSRPYMDLDRVGIYGFSAGGYDTVQAMYRHPNLYKVGISASGNHDFRVDKMGWNELWMDWPVNQQWELQSNLHQVERLKGKLLLTHGGRDSNVHPSASLRLAQAFLHAGIDVDFRLIPGGSHYLHDDRAYRELRWRYFLNNL